MRIIKFFQIILLIIPLEVIGQNLVPNPCFSEHNRCPLGGYGYFRKNISGWNNPTFATPDYYHRCSRYESGIPENRVGVSEAKCGDGYMGIILAGKENIRSKRNWREYIQAELSTPLFKDSLYCVKFYVKHPSLCAYKSSNIGALFTKRWFRRFREKVIRRKPQIVYDKGLIDGSKWHLVCGTYKAEGGEKFITIGNFDDYKNTEMEFIEERSNSRKYETIYAYYLIDDVSVVPISDKKLCNCSEKEEIQEEQYTEVHAKKTWQSGEVFTLKNVLFETGSAVLDTSSYQELNEIVNVLIEQKSLNIEISGHTDNVGQEFDNFRLSKNRAKSVRDYIISQGISKDRITYKGYGSKEPVTSNDTVEGRKKNRRVEIRVLE